MRGNGAPDALGGAGDDRNTLMEIDGRHPSMCSCIQREYWPASSHATWLLDGIDGEQHRNPHHQEQNHEV